MFKIKRNLLQDAKILLPPAELEHAASEIRIFQENIKGALKFLKNRYRRSFFSFLPKTPLFLIIGADNAGKSSLLIHSGLTLVDAEKKLISNPASTRYCNFWFSEKEIFVDTAGHYTTADPSNIVLNLAWRGLIKLIDNYKNRCPLAGLIVTIDLPLLAKDNSKRKEILTNIKRRIYEVAKYVKELPVFLVFTKNDLISGFCDFFADLDPKKREQAFGIDFKNLLGTPIQNFDLKYQDLLDRLHKRSLLRLHQEIDLKKRLAIFDFPLEMEYLKSIITEIINEIPSNGETKLHGVYFTSSLQQGKPTDYLLPSFTFGRDFDNRKEDNSDEKGGSSPKVYFINDLFSTVKNAAQKRSRRSLQSFLNFPLLVKFLLIILTILSFTTFFLYFNHKKNVVLINRLHEIVAADNDPSTNTTDFENLANASSFYRKISEQYHRSWWPLLKPKKISTLVRSAGENYHQKLYEVFSVKLQDLITKKLQNKETLDAFGLYRGLKIYLMLTDFSKLNVDYAKNWFTIYWQQQENFNQKNLALYHKYLNDYLAIKKPIKADKKLIEQTRTILNAKPTTELIYAILKDNDLNGEKLGLLATEMKSSIFKRENVEITKFYHKPNYQDFKKDGLFRDKSFVPSLWVLGDKKLEKIAEAKKERKTIFEINKLYLKDYADFWQNILFAVKIKSFTSVAHAFDELKLLASLENSPLLKIVRELKENVLLDAKDEQFEKIVTRNFNEWREVNIELLQEHLQKFADFYQLLVDDVSDNEEVIWRTTKDIIRSDKLPDPFISLRLFAKNQPEPLQTWLLTLIDNGWKILLSESKLYIDKIWSKQVVPIFKEKIAGRYPLSKSSKDDLSFVEFANFFGPNGVLSSFFNRYLREFVDTSDRYWSCKSVGGQKIALLDTTLELFIRADLIRKMFFSGISSLPSGNFTLTPKKLSPTIRNFTLLLDGQLVFFAKEKNMKKYSLSWPGTKNAEARIELVDTNGKASQFSFSGPWAWFKLLDSAQIETSGATPRRYEVIFGPNEEVKCTLVADRTINPYIPEIVDNFQIIEIIQ